MRFPITLIMICLLGSTVGCQSIYYSSLEKLGIEKREIVIDRVEAARDEQQNAKETFASALESFTALTNYTGGELESVYKKLNDSYQDSAKSADRVNDRIDKVESVSEALFAEWERELDQYSSDSLRRASQASLRDTRTQYATLIRKMRSASDSMGPVLDLFKDQVLFLKHNLNARAIASLDTEFAKIQSKVNDLVAEMEASIREADAFIKTL